MKRSLREVVIGLGCYAAYLAVRRAVWTERGRRRAQENAARVLAVEERLGIDGEQSLQRFALRSPRAVRACNAGYALGNVALSVGWLILLHRRGHPAFARERRAAVGAFVGALPVFLAFPTAPPRTMDGFVDTLADHGVDLAHPALTAFYNPIAAMPSHHVAFAVVTGFGRSEQACSAWTRWLWRGYPAAVSGVVVATGNHFVLDAVAGAALGGLARVVTR